MELNRKEEQLLDAETGSLSATYCLIFTPKEEQKYSKACLERTDSVAVVDN